ncbi:MAG TPA: site-specific integrase, partial [Acidimicrobiia bacterium]
MSYQKVSLEAGVDEYLVSLRVERGLSRNTLAAYQRDLSQYLDYLDGREPGPDDVAGFVTEMRGRQLADSTIARKIASVRGLHRFLVVEELREEDPTRLIDSPRRPD